MTQNPSSKLVELYGTKFEVNYPNVGQWMEIGNKWNNFSGLNDSSPQTFILKELYNAIEFFKVACPDIAKSLTHGSIEEMSMYEAKPILQAYIKDIKPWVDSWVNEYDDVFNLILDAREKVAQIEKDTK